MEIRIGTASWADPGFVADWYPRKLPAAERLAWYADQFNLVELNSSFYAIPEARMVQRWCEQTPKGFLFDVKLHKLLSRHSTTPQMLPPDLRKSLQGHKRVLLTPDLEKEVATRFLQAIAPFKKAKKLGALLLQLSPSFRPKTHRLSELEPLAELFGSYQLAVELRNADWVARDQLHETAAFFKANHLTFVCVDAPQASHFMIMPSIDLVTNPKLSYVRLHGRNAQGYITGRSVAERFDYKYNEKELQEQAERAARLAAQSDHLHVVYNNNTSNYAPVNARRFQEIVQETFPEFSIGPTPPMTLSRGQTMELDFAGAS